MRGTKRGFRRTIASLLVFSLCIAAVPALPAKADNKINDGTVGGGVYKLIQRRSESMIHTVGAELEVEKILVHSLHKKREEIGRASCRERV